MGVGHRICGQFQLLICNAMLPVEEQTLSVAPAHSVWNSVCACKYVCMCVCAGVCTLLTYPLLQIDLARYHTTRLLSASVRLTWLVLIPAGRSLS